MIGSECGSACMMCSCCSSSRNNRTVVPLLFRTEFGCAGLRWSMRVICISLLFCISSTDIRFCIVSRIFTLVFLANLEKALIISQCILITLSDIHRNLLD